MRISRRRAALAVPAIFAGASACGKRAQAQAPRWPTSTIRFVVAFPPGGPTDIVGRLVAAKIAEQRGWTVIVENKGGASGMLGMGEVARATPDGHTVLINASAHAVLPSTQRDKLTFDVASSFIPVTMLGRTPLMVTVTPSLPVRSMAELLAYARANPGRLNYTSGSLGGGPHLAAELLKLTAGIDMQFVPYRGSGPGLQDLAAGNVQVGIDSMTAAAPLVRGGQIRAIAVTSAERVVMFPDLPTVAETVPGYTNDTWVAAFVPARTPPDVVGRLHGAIVEAIHAPDVRDRLLASGTQPSGQPQAEFAALVATEMATWARVVRDANLRFE